MPFVLAEGLDEEHTMMLEEISSNMESSRQEILMQMWESVNVTVMQKIKAVKEGKESRSRNGSTCYHVRSNVVWASDNSAYHYLVPSMDMLRSVMRHEETNSQSHSTVLMPNASEV